MKGRGKRWNLDNFATVSRGIWQNLTRKTVGSTSQLCLSRYRLQREAKSYLRNLFYITYATYFAQFQCKFFWLTGYCI